eukprot:5098033-Pyramimonas_sp.AAC.1
MWPPVPGEGRQLSPGRGAHSPTLLHHGPQRGPRRRKSANNEMFTVSGGFGALLGPSGSPKGRPGRSAPGASGLQD